MNFRLFFLCILFSFGYGLKAQVLNTDVSHLSFYSENEKLAFTNYLKDSSQIVPLMGIIGNDGKYEPERYQKHIDEIIAKLQEQGVQSKKPKKQVKLIYNSVHDVFFTQYKDQITFSDIFVSGHYNCVSATAIYAIVLEKLGIPYSLKEEPNHVYLMAYPGKENIIMESTSPANGYQMIPLHTKQVMVQQLIEQKIITKNDVAQLGIEGAFHKYFYGNSTVSMSDLISMMYTNEAYFAIQMEEYKKGRIAMEKAYRLVNSKKIEQSLMASIFMELNALDDLSLDYAKTVVKLSKFMDRAGVNRSEIVGEFNRFLQYYLLNKNDKQKYDEIHQIFSKVEDEEALNEINFNFYYEQARMQFNRRRGDLALPLVEEALSYDSASVIGYELLSFCILQQASKPQLTTEGRLAYVNKYLGSYPKLEKEPKIESIILSCYIDFVSTNVHKRRISEAVKYLSLFEDKYDPATHYEIPVQNLVLMYDQLGMYYFKSRQTTKAKRVFQKGLEYVPSAYVLRQKLDILL
ncbi:hypothetical protein [Sediminitomix flava]|uniref:Uncharacterized protein n=1 Tax=Sediminitomix flava TaxID=379075 RepID=A0A315ZWY4_SEDFL|nr:hypothetical protein [Sediminitomix flava]PWJ41837.1 hypothetical protein BC781_10387 [Sediminitomix flava]